MLRKSIFQSVAGAAWDLRGERDFKHTQDPAVPMEVSRLPFVPRHVPYVVRPLDTRTGGNYVFGFVATSGGW